jgi:pyruvate/2-oxoglutarate dehydrogenase complex dihydrolipoamide acyltransferase (E2) component
MLDTRSLPDAVEALVFKFALEKYHTSATRVRHRRVMGQITRAAYEMDRGRHFARDTVTGKWVYESWINTAVPEADLDMLQPTSFCVLEEGHGMATPHEPAPAQRASTTATTAAAASSTAPAATSPTAPPASPATASRRERAREAKVASPGTTESGSRGAGCGGRGWRGVGRCSYLVGLAANDHRP